MKKITIRNENGYEKLKCLKFDCCFDSFKEIWNIVHERMAYLAEKCKNCEFQNYDCLSFDDDRYVYNFKQIINIWKQNNAEYAWIKIFECNGRMYDGDKAEDLRNAFLPFMYEINYRIYFDAIGYSNYAMIYKYKNGLQVFSANERFIDMFAEDCDENSNI